MRRFYGWIFAFFFVTTSFITASSQTRSLISGTYDSAKFNDLVRDIENQTRYHFYYNAGVTDSLRVTMSFQNSEVSPVLGQLFSGTDLHFAIDEHNNIFVTEGREIMAALPDDFFNQGELQNKAQSAPAFDYTEYEKREK